MVNSCVNLTLDVRLSAASAIVTAKQGDTGRMLRISLSDGGKPYRIGSDCYALFAARKPDGTRILNSCIIQEDRIFYPFTPQTCAAVGSMPAEIKLYGADGKLLTTGSFLLEVQEAVFSDGDEIASENEMNALDALILETVDLKTELEEKLQTGAFIGPPGPEGPPGDDYVLTEADIAEIAKRAAELTKDLRVKECSADLKITGFTREDGTFSLSAAGLRTDFVPMGGVTEIFGNAGFDRGCTVIAFYGADKVFLSEISVNGTAFLANGMTGGEGAFALDVSGEAYADAAYFVVSTHRAEDSGNSDAQAFSDDFCRYTKLMLEEGTEKAAYRIRHSTIAFFGDSLTSGTEEGDYPSLIASVTGAAVTNYGISGATLAAGTGSSHHIVDLVGDYTGTDDIVCISGGFGDMDQNVPLGTLTAGYADALDSTTVIGALETIFRKLLTDHTASKIYYVITHKAASAETTENALGLTFTDYHDAIVSVLEKYSIPFYDAFADSGFITSENGPWGDTMRKLYTVNEDGIHPNAEGFLKYYVYQIIAMMEHGHSSGRADKDSTPGEKGEPGRGIVSTERTSGTGAAGTTDIYTITYTDGTTSTFTVYNGANGKDGGTGSGGSGENGEDGATFTPYVDAAGNLSWSNDKGLANPDTVNIMGPRGEQGKTGETGPQGPAGQDGAKGETGAAGQDGTSATHSWNGTILTVTSASGTSSADLKGDKGDKGDPGSDGAKGDKGDPGEAGKDGVSVTHSWNGTVLRVVSASGTSSADLKGDKGEKGDQGIQGEPGTNGTDGYSPVRGTDYWTDADIAQIKSYVDDAILGGVW